MSAVLMTLLTIVAILLIIIVLLQNSKGGGLDSSFGNVNQLGGVAQSTETIEKATWTLAGLIGFLSLLTAMYSAPSSPTVESGIEQTGAVDLSTPIAPLDIPE
ncbi:MAG: preprotein translocase subunit SecG [Flavobacteriales bacterium]|nr:preprotein translocase subunit SecG [Flavobacteriales bacterium]